MAINTEKITALVAALTNKFEEKVNKVTSWSSTTSDTKYPSEKLVKDSLDALDSAKESVSNKTTSWSVNTSDDTVPSPSTHALNSRLVNILSNWGSGLPIRVILYGWLVPKKSQ